MHATTELLTRADLAARLGVRPHTIGIWRAGRIPARRLSPKVVRYDLDAVLRALEARQTQTPPRQDGVA
jgi:hypothetical protein